MYDFTINTFYEARKIPHSVGSWYVKKSDGSQRLFASVVSEWKGPLLYDYFITIGEWRDNQIDDILN